MNIKNRILCFLFGHFYTIHITNNERIEINIECDRCGYRQSPEEARSYLRTLRIPYEPDIDIVP